jgi:hypothetical protein
MTMKHRRYIERYVDIDSDDSDDDDDLDDAEFIELFRSHVKRKKLRKKVRANPEVRVFAAF